MEKKNLVIGVHVLVALGMFSIGAFRFSNGQTAVALVNVLLGVGIIVAGVYLGRTY